MKYDPRKHHRRTIRLPHYDYSQPGAYFITIVSHQRALLFGKILDGLVRLNPAGQIVEWEWQRLAQQFPYVELDAFVVMPNHLHGIIILHDPPVGATHLNQEDTQSRTGRTPPVAQSAMDGSPSHLNQEDTQSGTGRTPPAARSAEDGSSSRAIVHPRGRAPRSLAEIIGQFKSRVTKRLKGRPDISNTPIWQRNYYEHIIRDEEDHRRVHEYIHSNPANWHSDEENPENE